MTQIIEAGAGLLLGPQGLSSPPVGPIFVTAGGKATAVRAELGCRGRALGDRYSREPSTPGKADLCALRRVGGDRYSPFRRGCPARRRTLRWRSSTLSGRCATVARPKSSIDKRRIRHGDGNAGAGRT